MRNNTLKNQILLFFIIAAFVPIIGLSFSFFFNNARANRVEFERLHAELVQKVAEQTNQSVTMANTLANQMLADSGLQVLMQRKSTQLPHQDTIFLKTINSMGNLYRYSALYPYITALTVVGENGTDIRFGADAALMPVNNENLQNSSWNWGELQQNLWEKSSVKQVVPVQFAYYAQGGGIKGKLSMYLNPTVFADCYHNATLGQEGLYYLVRQDGAELTQVGETNLPDELLKTCIEEMKKSNAASVQFETKIFGGKKLVSAIKVNGGKWLAIEVASLKGLRQQEFLFASTTLLLAIAVLLLCFYIFWRLSRYLTEPIGKIVAHVNEIGKGNLSVPPLNEQGHEEIVDLSHNINKMQQDISRLMQENIRAEKEKRELEMQMLQHQINPHFLYNTLNSIKLMATLQGSAGIEKMLAALGRIMRYNLEQHSDKIALCKEVAMFEDYMYLQKIRCHGRILWKVEIEEELKQCLVPRFSVQPLAENAVMHGLASSEASGEVIISAKKQDDKLIISIYDNGSGMTPEQTKRLNSSLKKLNKKEKSTSIGMLNVQRRIQLLYGEDCGLHVQSSKNKFTQVDMILKIGRGAENESDYS